MADRNKVSFRLSPALQAALAAHVRQHGGQVSDILHEALEAYLGLRPAARPTAQAQVSDVSDMAATIQALVAEVASLQARLEQLEAALTPSAPRVRQRPTLRPTPAQPEAPQPRTAGGQRKLTPRQQRALRDKYQRGVPVEALMEEYSISRASVFRYLQSDKRAGGTSGP